MANGVEGAPPPPNQEPGASGASHQQSAPATEDQWPAESKNNKWSKNTKIKTCKCGLCSKRVAKYSWQCSKCTKHICSECVEPTGTSGAAQKFRAEVELATNCGCAYPSGQAPTMDRMLSERGLVHVPPHTDEEDRKAKEQKRLIKEKKAAALRHQYALLSGSTKAPASAAAKNRKATSSEPDIKSAPEDPDEAYQRHINADPTMSADPRPKRKPGRKPKYVDPETPSSPDSDSDDSTPRPAHKKAKTDKAVVRKHELSDPFVSASKVDQAADQAHPIQHLQGGHTVIIGAGVLGLCIARELAHTARETGTNHTITVIEARGSYCELASKYCAGFLTALSLPNACDVLREPAAAAWLELFEEPGFQDAVKASDSSPMLVIGAGKLNREMAPSWAQGRVNDSFVADDKAVGRL